MAGAAPRQYGLIVPKKKQAALSSIKKPSVFGDSSSDEESGSTVVGKVGSSSLWRENKKNAMQIESHQSVLKALEEDANVFEYDSLYDEMQEKKKKQDPRLAKKDRTSKYISKLKKVAERRKVEQDIIYERKVQREMEQEGKEYGDKDTFLTGAYRKKLEERQKLEEELKIAAKREEMNDVTKQVDISRFHRTLLNRMTEPGSSSSESNSREGRLERSGEQPGRVEGGRERRSSSDSDGDRSEHSRSQEKVPRSRSLKNEPASSPGEEDASPSRHVEGEEGETPKPGGSEAGAEPDKEETKQVSLFPPTVDREMKRKVASAKRANEESLSSAKERYLARKKAKLTAPIVSDN